MTSTPGAPEAPETHPPPAGGRRLRLDLPRPERRRRGDLVAAALISVAVLLLVVVVVATGDAAGTDDRVATKPLVVPPEGPLPTALVEAWRADSPATPTPLVVGPAVVTAGPDGVVGHDAVTGAPAWSYSRPETPCTVGAGFGDVLAIFRTDGALGTWCSDVAALDPATGARGPSRHTDLREGTRLLADRDHVTGTGRDYIETWRSDLVATTAIGALPNPVQPPSEQPRAGCANGSVAVGGGSLAAVERCPGEASDRLTVFDADPPSSEKPQERISVLTGVVGARLVALTDRRVAIAAPDGTLRVLDAGSSSEDGTGASPVSYPLGTAAGPTADPPGLAATIRPVGPVLLWWTGTATVGLDPDDLRPRWALPGTLGAGAAWPGTTPATTVLIPVPGGLAVVDAATGAPRGATIPVDRAGTAPDAPVAVATVGTVLVELRGATTVALRPPS